MRVPVSVIETHLVGDAPAGNHALGLFGRLIERFRLDAVEEDAARKLAAMDDRMLADIGLRRSDLPLRRRGVHDLPR